MKYEWRKKDKNLYLDAKKPVMISIPKMTFLVVDGKGNPNGKQFNEEVELLYAVSYGIKMLGKKFKDYYEYTVFPLEGVWDLEDGYDPSKPLNKDKLIYSIMIRQPAFVNEAFLQKIMITLKEKKPHLAYNRLRLETITEGLCVQMIHNGPFDDEPKTFVQMMAFAEQNNLKRVGHIHREIYLSDPRRVESSKLKTMLRFKVEK